MSIESIENICKQRDDQIKRVIKALEHQNKEEAISILCMWMSMDQVNVMLKTLERSQ